jgi:hypothetical protein
VAVSKRMLAGLPDNDDSIELLFDIAAARIRFQLLQRAQQYIIMTKKWLGK